MLQALYLDLRPSTLFLTKSDGLSYGGISLKAERLLILPFRHKFLTLHFVPSDGLTAEI